MNALNRIFMYYISHITWRGDFIPLYLTVCCLACACGNQWILRWFVDLSGINTVQTFKAYYYWRGYWFLFSWGDLLSCNMWCHYPRHCLRDKRLVGRGHDCCRFGVFVSPQHDHIFTPSCATVLLTSRWHEGGRRDPRFLLGVRFHVSDATLHTLLTRMQLAHTHTNM